MKYKGKHIGHKTQINTTSYLQEGYSIEEKLRQATITKEPIEVDYTPEIYQSRKEGVDPMYDIRSDKFELAQAACDTMTRTYLLGRKNREDFGNKKAEEFTYVTDSDGNIVENNVNQ